MYLGVFDFTLEKRVIHFGENKFEKTVLFPDWKMVLNKGFKPDPKTKEVVQKYQDMIPKENSEVICLIAKGLNSRTEKVRTKETNFANMYADALKDEYGCDIGICTGGGIRGDDYYFPG